MVFNAESFVLPCISKLVLSNWFKLIWLFNIHFVNLKSLLDNNCGDCVNLFMRSLTRSLNLYLHVNFFIHFILENNLKVKVSRFYERFGRLFDTRLWLNLDSCSKNFQTVSLILFNKNLEKYHFNIDRYRSFSFLKI